MSRLAACLVFIVACARNGPVDLDGNAFDPLAARAPATVLLFVGTTCPISNRYAPEIIRLYDRFRSSGADFHLVYVDKNASKIDIEKHLNEYHFPIHALRDPGRRLQTWARATTTPEAAVFSRGALVYHGRIDDRFADLGRERAAATTHELADAVDAALANRAPPVQETTPVGCAIP